MKQRFILLSALYLLLVAADTPPPARFTIFTIGDSTMANKPLAGGNPERGWAQMLPECLSEEIRVDNHAQNGRSSKSFIDEGRWDKVLALLKPGDYVFIQFGHNDEKPDTARHTEPGSTFDENLRRYVRQSRAKGAVPVLFNAIVRRHFVDGVLTDTHGAYLDAPRRVAQELNVPFVDANRITHQLVADLGDESSKQLYLWFAPNTIAAKPEGKQDDTHLNEQGARRIAGLLMDAVAREVPALSQYVRRYDLVVAKNSRLNTPTENYPYRSDVLWVTVPDHADWTYRTGERANVEVQLYCYGIPQDGLEVTYEIGDDMLPADASGRVTLKNGKATINIGTARKPGFRDLRLTAVVGGKSWKHHIKLAFSPEKIEPFTQMPADFRDFWDKNKAEAARFPLSYTRERVEEYCSDIADCYLVRLALNRSQCIYGYLFIPKDAEPGTCPVVFCPPGAGVKTIKNPQSKLYYTEQGCIRFVIEIHGLDPRMSDTQFAEISAAFNSGNNGYMQNGLDNRDNYYMKRVYLACIRSIDLLTSLPQWDGKNVFVHGGSQGGALTLVTAALDPRVTACVANHPAISDMGGYSLPGHTGGWPHMNRLNDMFTPNKLRTMAYYDVVNFARLITVPTRMTWGFNDDVCPPTTSYAVWNVLTCPKEALITPINEHWTTEETEYGHLLWLLKQKR